MLDMHYLREHAEDAAAALALRDGGLSPAPALDLDRERREMLGQVEQLKKQRNESSRKIGAMMKAGEDASEMKAETKRVGEQIAEIEKRLQTVESDLTQRLSELPNLPHESVPHGASEADNRVDRTWGEAPSFSFEPQAHWDLGTALGILDFERAAKISGARFALYLGAGARLERALIQFMLDLHTREHGYTEVIPPFMVHAEALFGTGQLPKFEADLFKAGPGDFYLIPTAEVPVTNIHADEILDAEQLPVAYCAYTPCFRSEAGSYGQDVRGLIRQHQFNKVELVRFSRPEDSFEQLEQLTAHAETVLQKLGLHYRTVSLCTGDLGFASAKTYDLEVWLPAQKLFREISSCSNFTDFQARRAKIRFRPEAGAKPRLLHTLNGSGLAVGRTVVAILENYQQEDGSVAVPEALQPYMGGLEKIEAPS